MMIEKIKNFLKLNKKNTSPNDVYAKIDELYNSLGSDDICIQVGTDLAPFAEKFCERIHEVRQKLADDTGLILPPVRLIDNLNIQENEYKIIIRDSEAFSGFTVPKEDYASNEIMHALERTCIENVDRVMTNEMVEKYMDRVHKNNGWMMCYLSRLMPSTGIKVILTDLIKNGQSINDIDYIFEKICEQATKSRDIYTIPDAHKIAENLKTELR